MYKKITFNSNGLKLKGNLFYPKDFDATKKYSAIIVSGSWTTVKEQMAGLYASKLAEKGFIALAFDFRNFGESEGEPRFFESPKNAPVIPNKTPVSKMKKNISLPPLSREKLL